jgi:anti-anti-sigma factor
MDIDSEQLDGGVVKINLSGRMDIVGAQEIDTRFSELTAPPSRAVIVDLSRVNFISSAGIRTLLVQAKGLRTRGGRMVLLNPDAMISRVLELGGIDLSIGVFRDLQAACAAATRT